MAEKKCNNCGTNEAMTKVTMSSADWQRNEQRHERREKRLVWVIVLLIVLLVGSNIGWIYYESQFEEVTTTETVITQENEDGYNSYIGNDGDIVNGKADYNNKKNN